MSGKLTAKYTTGKTFYFQILSDDSGQFWNGATLEVYTTANIATYKVSAVELGTASGYYQASIPSLAAGFYTAAGYEQLGGSPAETDTFAGDETFYWDGSERLMTSQIAAGGITDSSFAAIPADPTGVPSTYLSILQWIGQRLGLAKVTKDSTAIKVFRVDNSTTRTTNAISSSGGTDTVSKAT